MNIARKELELPSGAKTTIRRLSPIDFAILGKFPSTTKVATEESKEEETENGEYTIEQREYLIEMQKLCLLKATGAIIDNKGKTFRLVDKPFDELNRPKPKTHTEICVADIEQDDCDMICREVMDLSGFKKEVAANAATFPEKQGDGVGVSQAG